MKNSTKSELVIRVQYADDPKKAEAAMELLRQGFQRGLMKLAAERARDSKKDGAA